MTALQTDEFTQGGSPGYAVDRQAHVALEVS